MSMKRMISGFMKVDREKGFTLIELMIVVAILGILAAIAIPNFMRFQAKSKQSEAKSNLGAIGTTAEAFRSENDTYVATWAQLGWAPQGTTRYAYYYSGYQTAIASNGALGGTPTTAAAPCVPADPTTGLGAVGFLAGSSGQIDTDLACDAWTYNDARVLLNPSNDVSS